MKKIFKIVAAAFMASGVLYALDWGGKISDDTAFSDNSPSSLKVRQSNTAILWLTVPLGSKNNDYFAAEALYNFKYDKTEGVKKPVTHIVDLSLLKFSINRTFGKKGLSINIGRYFIADATFTVFSQTSDGIAAAYEDDTFSISAYAGYTGLLNAKNTTIINAPNHRQKDENDSVYALSAHYIPAGAVFMLPNVFANQRLTVQGWGFVDLNGYSFNRFYLSAGLDGNLLNNLSYNLSLTMGTTNFETISNLSKLRFLYYPLHFLSIYTSALYASGKNGALSPFTGFTSQSADLSNADIQYSSVLKFEAGAALSLFNKAIAFAALSAVLNIPEQKADYKGFQYQAGCRWNIFDDVQAGISFEQFFGKASVDDKTTVSVNAAFVF